MSPFTDEEILRLRCYFDHRVPVDPEEGMALCDQLLAERAWARAAMLYTPHNLHERIGEGFDAWIARELPRADGSEIDQARFVWNSAIEITLIRGWL